VARALTPTERHRVGLMFGSIAALHIVGFGVFIAFVVPSHHRGLGIGVAGLAYSLGLRHAFDADHIAAIDSTTRKLMSEGKRPLSVGYWFSLGHSTIVVAIGVGLVVAEKTVYGAVSHNNSPVEQFGGIFGTVVSATFLYLIALLNVIVLAGIIRVFRSMRRGNYDEAELERQLESRGLMFRFFGRWMKAIDREWHMYPVGVLFGLGFDTATEVGVLGISAAQAGNGISLWSLLVFPALFTAGMALIDTADSVLMTGAYGWAFMKPIRKLYYNLTITAVSVLVALLIGSVEGLGLLADRLALRGAFWEAVAALNDRFSMLGYLIVAIFAVSWILSILIYRLKGYDRLEPVTEFS
jgi:nickel/cobalt transporter (NiCoT) family protein